MARQRKKLGEILIKWDLLNEEALDAGLKFARENGKRIGEALIDMGTCTDEDVTKALAAQFGWEFIDLSKDIITPESLSLLPERIIREHTILPISIENERLKVVLHDPLDLETMDLLRFKLNTKELEPVLAPRNRIEDFISKHFDPVKQSIDSLPQSFDVSVDTEATKKEEEDGDAPIIKLINLIITEAVRTRASDIHIEPMANRVRVRYRVDGVCVERESIPARMRAAVTARFKLMAGIDIAEKRLPQDGRIKQHVGDGDIDFRVSALPSVHGESIVLRILRPESVKIGVHSLGFEDEDYERFLKIIKRPNGIFLVTGPTGSGKTTTLYGALQELNRPDKKIITAEDPVEYNFVGMNQCQVREDIGLGFERILRSMLRQAPNIILVGEIRDLAVGEIAIQAALTGHLVFSTLHTNDAPSAITRLIDMGIKPFLVASSIQAVMAQRLVRVICKECRDVDPNPDERFMQLCGFSREELGGRPVYKGYGCTHCLNTGYRGRLGIFEMMTMNNEIRELALARSPSNVIRKAARAAGMRTLVEDGKQKVLRGITTPEEIARITQIEGMVQNGYS